MQPGNRAACDDLETIAIVLAAMSVSAVAQGTAPERGGLIAAQRCAQCHAVGRQGESPARAAPPFREIGGRGPIPMLEEALRTGVISGHDEMPMFEMKRSEVADLIAYIEHMSRGAEGRK